MRRALVPLIAVAVAGAVLLPSASARYETPAMSCPASPIHYRADPRAPGGVNGVPWIASTNMAFRGYLFYFGGTRWARVRPARAWIFTTRARTKVNPKVLWVAQGSSISTLRITGTRLDRRGSFSSSYDAAIGGRQFPSYVLVPAAGCWRVSPRSGSARGSVIFNASDKP